MKPTKRSLKRAQSFVPERVRELEAQLEATERELREWKQKALEPELAESQALWFYRELLRAPNVDPVVKIAMGGRNVENLRTALASWAEREGMLRAEVAELKQLVATLQAGMPQPAQPAPDTGIEYLRNTPTC